MALTQCFLVAGKLTQKKNGKKTIHTNPTIQNTTPNATDIWRLVARWACIVFKLFFCFLCAFISIWFISSAAELIPENPGLLKNDALSPARGRQGRMRFFIYRSVSFFGYNTSLSGYSNPVLWWLPLHIFSFGFAVMAAAAQDEWLLTEGNCNL